MNERQQPSVRRDCAYEYIDVRGWLSLLSWIFVFLILLSGAIREPAFAAETAPPAPPPATGQPPVSLEAVPGEEVPAEEPTAPPSPAPVSPGLPPSPQAQTLTPVPEQFEWIQRDIRPDPILQPLLTLREGLTTLREGPPVLFMTLFVSEEYDDNTFDDEENTEDDFITRIGIGTVFRLQKRRSFISLSNNISGEISARFSEQNEVGFANLALTAGHQAPRWSLALSESFVRDNDSVQATDSGRRTGRSNFLRNRVSPQFQYNFTPRTSANLGYTNTIVRDDDPEGEDSTTHAVNTGFQHRFTRRLNGNINYTFQTSSEERGNDSRSHRASGGLGYALGPLTSLSLDGFGTIFDEDGGENANSYGATLGINRRLTQILSLVVAVGANVFDPEAGGLRVFPTWQLGLSGNIPITRRTTLNLSSQQIIEDTSGDIDDIGIVNRISVQAVLNHLFTRRLSASLFARYNRDEDLISGGTGDDERGEIDNFWRAGFNASYALSQIFTLSLGYEYRKRESNEREDFSGNRVTATLSAGFSLF